MNLILKALDFLRSHKINCSLVESFQFFAWSFSGTPWISYTGHRFFPFMMFPQLILISKILPVRLCYFSDFWSISSSRVNSFLVFLDICNCFFLQTPDGSQSGNSLPSFASFLRLPVTSNADFTVTNGFSLFWRNMLISCSKISSSLFHIMNKNEKVMKNSQFDPRPKLEQTRISDLIINFFEVSLSMADIFQG